MTTAPEAYLAREAEIAFSTIAHITDYDVWHDEPVNVDMVIATMQRNVPIVKEAIAHAVESLDENATHEAHTALDTAFTTDPSAISDEMKDKLHPIVARYFSKQQNG